MNKGFIAPDGQIRCHWCGGAPEFLDYHDHEWGLPVADDQQLFEKLCLESFQSGLSWRTILNKRDNFRLAFEQFDFNKVALFAECDVERLLTNKGIVRHRGKIQAVINNAQRAQEMVQQHGSLAAFFWRYEPTEHAIVPQSASTSAESVALAKALKKLGWKFVGPTTIYAFMQAMGIINDHALDCMVERHRNNFKRP